MGAVEGPIKRTRADSAGPFDLGRRNPSGFMLEGDELTSPRKEAHPLIKERRGTASSSRGPASRPASGEGKAGEISGLMGEAPISAEGPASQDEMGAGLWRGSFAGALRPEAGNRQGLASGQRDYHQRRVAKLPKGTAQTDLSSGE
jgi:hypothetical protein